MTGQIIWMISVWSCAIIFLSIGIYASQRKEPMWFWSGSTVSNNSIKDIPAYNKENARMWIIYSLPYWICGLAYLWYPKESAIFLMVYVGLGFGGLVGCYLRIEKKYKK